MSVAEDQGAFYLRYYLGHKGKFGHEFLEYEFRPDGKLRFANNSNYKNDTMIRKEVFLTPVLKECRRIIAESKIMKEDDNNWPEPDRVGRQELEIVMGNVHISFTTSKIGSLVDVQSSKDPEGLRIFYYLVQGGSDVAHDTIDMVVEAVVDLAVHSFGSYLETLIFRRHRGCCCTNAPGLPNAAESPNTRHPSDRPEKGGHVPANAPNAHVPANAPNAHVPIFRSVCSICGHICV